jgi:sugar lactone lactonase YvrE
MLAAQETEAVTFHGEGPVWSERWGGLRWVDMLAGDILSLGPDGSVSRRHVARIAAAIRPRRGGGAVLGIERGFALEAPDGTITAFPPLWDDADLRMNEGACGPDGAFYCGSLSGARVQGAASLDRLDPDGSVTVITPATVSNGLDWTPDGRLAYYVDTATHRIDVFDHDPVRGLVDRRPFVELAAEVGSLDGLTVDAQGGVWVAIHRGGAVRHYSPAGELVEIVEVPTPRVTACTFGGPGLDTLFITTSREGIDPADDPRAGALFRAEVGVVGQPVREFAG